MNWTVRLAGLLLGLAPASALSGEFYVAPGGSDANPGTKDKPFATLAHARDVVRQANAKLREPVTVLLHGGTYYLHEPVVFGPADSGTAECPVTYGAYPGEKPVISGGKRIAGWKRGGDKVWTVEIPEVKQGTWYFRQLFANGQRRQRARLPREGHYKVAAPPDSPKWSFKFQPGQIDPKWRNLDDVEVVLLQYWTEARLRIKSIDQTDNIVRFTGAAFRPMTWSNGWYVENVYEGLTDPGEWYLDRKSGVLHYWPLPGENMEELEVIAPVARQWIRLEGDYKNGNLVRYINFRGLRFHHSSWSLDKRLGYSYQQAAVELTPESLLWNGYPAEGLSTPQSQVEVPAGIWARGAHHVRFEDNEIAHTGAWGIYLRLGCHDNAVVGNYIHDMGAGGIRVGGTDVTFDDAEETCRTTITDNILRDGCAVYLGAPAVWIGMSSGNRIAHNEITGRWQWAVSFGFQWAYMPPQNARDNVVEYNHCHHVINSPLSTHAVIYSLGVQPGSVIRHNLVHHCTGAHGICLDNGSAGVLVEHNIVHHGQRGNLVFNHDDLGNIIQNNIFAFATSGQMFRHGDTGRLDQTGILYRNIFYWKNDKLFGRDKWPEVNRGPWKTHLPDWTTDFDIVMDYNLYYDAGGQPVKFLTFTFDEWKKKGMGKSSIVADPLFVDPENGDFTLKPDSPAFKLGFKPIDLTGVGPRPRPGTRSPK